jgi:acetylornithine deacetylase/succinyl-diaminopimelate desuccinylase-like protein
MSKTYMQTIQDAYAFNPVGSHGNISLGTAGTAIPVPAGAQSLLVQALDQDVRFVFSSTGSGTATGFVITADADVLGFGLGGTLGTIHATAESGTASLQYQFLGR